jgi:hypothetical protein
MDNVSVQQSEVSRLINCFRILWLAFCVSSFANTEVSVTWSRNVSRIAD